MARVRARAPNQAPSRNQFGARTPARAGNPTLIPSSYGKWVPAVSNVNAGANLVKFVLYQGGGKGWLYQGATLPRMVSVTATQQGGPSGLLVAIGPPPLAANPNDNYSADARVAARAGRRNPAQRSRALPWIMVMATWAPGGPSAEPFAQQIQVDQYFVLAPNQGAGPKPGDLGWLYVTGSGKPPKHVRVVEFRNEGITEMEVRVVDVASVGGTLAAPSAPQANRRPYTGATGVLGPTGLSSMERVPNQGPVAGGDTLVGELPRPPDPTAGCCIIEEVGTFTDPDTQVTIQTGGYVNCPGGEAQWGMHGRPLPTVAMAAFEQNGQRMITVETGDGSFTLPACAQPPGTDETIDCCVDPVTMTLRCAEGDPRNGAQVTGLGPLNNGLQTLSYIDPTDGVEKNIRLPVCDQPPTGECCVDAATSTLVCDANDPRNGMSVKLVTTVQPGIVVVQLPDGTQQTFPLCQQPPPGKCCFDPATSTLRCTAGDPRDGVVVSVQNQFTQPDGKSIVVVRLPDGSALDAEVCPQPPDVCCYDVATGTLRCPRNSGLNGQQVSLVSMTRNPDGSMIAIVQIQGQSGVATFPVCDDHVTECCYDAQTQKLVCPNDPGLSGTDAAIVASWNQAGQIWVWATWAGGGARMPLCPGQTECPPVFCCVNFETKRFVCPGRTDINGQPAQLVDIINDGGFNWGVLADGTRLPLCGRDCPPPEMCPGCPGCPPGMWMSPDGACTPPPDCQPPRRCPPGTLLNTDTMECVRCNGGEVPCPPYPGPQYPWPPIAVPSRAAARAAGRPNPAGKPCCDECAQKARAGNPGDCGCKGKQTNPKVRPRVRRAPVLFTRRRGPR